VVVVGGGFGGVQAVRALRREQVQVTLVDRRNFHLFQPLTYQVATGALAPSEVAYPLRAVFKGDSNVEVLLAEVSGFDLDRRQVLLRGTHEVPAPDSLPYDTLIVAAGSSYSYFGHDEFAAYASEVKTLESAVNVLSKILRAFERAESARAGTSNPDLTFVIVGAGPTGVEMAGQIAELARSTLRRDFHHIEPRQARIVLIDAGERVLASFPPSLSRRAARSLERLGVTVMVNQNVTNVDTTGVTLEAGDGTETQIVSNTVIWAAGVMASGLARTLGELAGAEVDKGGRVVVEPDLTLSGHPDVLVLGDMVRVRDRSGSAQLLPGVAPVAIQQGRYAGKLVANRLAGRETAPFRYVDKGNVATIGRARAVVDLRLLRLSGLPAWVVWLVVHLWYLMGFRNRLLVILQWSISFFTGGRGARLITDPPPVPGGSSVPPRR
jgi:NADH dehydrogenase